MIKCRVKVKAGRDSYQYSGLFDSTWHALMDAAAKFNQFDRVITVSVVR